MFYSRNQSLFNYYVLFLFHYSIPSSFSDAASPTAADSSETSRGATERPLSLPQHQARQQPRLSVSSPRSCLQQVSTSAACIHFNIHSSYSRSSVLFTGNSSPVTLNRSLQSTVMKYGSVNSQMMAPS